MCIPKTNLTCPNCNRSFKRKDHFEKHGAKCSALEDKTEAEDSPSMINSFEGSSLLYNLILLSAKQEAEQVNNQTSDQITENVHIQNDSQHSNTFEETLFTNSQIMDNLFCTSRVYEHNITNKTTCTPPRRKQLRTAKRRERKFFKLSPFLVDAGKSEKKKMLEKAVNEHDHLMSCFVGDTMNYFQKLIRDGRKSFAAKVRGAKLLYKFFGSKLNDIEYQRWLADEFSQFLF